MKYITLIIGLLVVGCGKQEQADTNESTPTTNTNKVDGTTEKPVKELTAEEKKVVGTYEHKFAGTVAKQRLVFEENGGVKLFRSHGKDIECKWFVVDGEIQIHPSQWERGGIDVYRINTDDNNATKPITSITQIAGIRDGKRRDYGRERTHEKIKSPKEAPSKSVEIANPIVEKAIRKQIKKPTGELTEADLEKVTRLDIRDNGLTDVKGLEKLTQLTSLDLRDNKLTDVKVLEKLTQLTYLDLSNNPDLTTTQINQLKKTMPKCLIGSNPTK